MAVASASAFLDILAKSQLASSEQVQTLRGSLANFPDAKALAVHLVKEGTLTRWQAGALLAGNHRMAIGKYQLLSQLGAGKTGRVYLARHVEMERQAALKILPRRADASATKLQQFLEQARAVSSLDHPNLIHTYDVDSESEQFYLVMEYFPGDDLQSLVEKEGPLAPGRAADIVRQAAEGLAHAAEKGLVHGDIRPSSLAVDRGGQVKVLHLGVVELAGPAIKTFDEKDPATANYAAPEFRAGHATPLADIYSLGCVLYFLWTGKPPFAEGDFRERRRQHRVAPPPDATALRSDVPPALAKLCCAMMAKEPADRPPSAQAVAQALAAWLAENPSAAPQRPKPAAAIAPRPSEPELKVTAANAPASQGPAASADAADLAIPKFDLGSKRKPAKSGAASRPPASGEAAKPAETKTNRGAKNPSAKPWDKRLAIGLGMGGVAVLAVVGAAVAFFAFSGNDSQQVAQAPAEKKPPAEPDVVDGQVLAEETLDGDLFSSSASTPAPSERAPSAAPAGEPTARSPATAPPPSAIASAATTEANATTSASVSDAAVPEAQPPAPSEEPASSPAATAVAAAPAPNDAPATDAVAADAAPAAPPEPKPASRSTTEKTKNAPLDPFAAFKQDAVSLPPLDETAAATGAAPVVLATVRDDPESGCFVRLSGGDTAHKGREVFSLEADDPGFRNRAWTVFVGLGESGEKDRQPIARLALDAQHQLTFQWLPEAAQQHVANYLRNCLLSITIGDKTKDAALREPAIVEPLTLSLDKGGAREQFDLEWPPEAERLQVEITSLEGPFPKYAFEPQPTLAADKGKTNIVFGNAPNQLLMVQAASTMSRKFTLALTPYLKIGNQSPRFNLSQLQQVAASANAQYQEMNNRVTRKVGPAEAIKQMELMLPQQQALATGYTELLQKALELKDTGRVHFRLFFTVGQRQVDILKTAAGGAPAAAPADEPAKKKNAARGDNAKAS